MIMLKVAAKICPVGRGEEVVLCFWLNLHWYVANVACSAWATLCTCCHSVSLPLSGDANGDINQFVDTHAKAVMCHHAGVSCDG